MENFGSQEPNIIKENQKSELKTKLKKIAMINSRQHIEAQKELGDRKKFSERSEKKGWCTERVKEHCR